MNRLRLLILMTLLGFTVPLVASPDAWAQDKKSKRSKDKAEKADKADKDDDEAAADGEEADAPAAAQDQTAGASSLQRGRRMEFDARLIRGERASGAVFLFQRATRPLPSMVKRRTSYLDDTVTKTLGDESADEFRRNQSEAIEKRIRAEEEERRKAREASIQKAEKLEKEKAEKDKADREKAAREKSDKK